MDWCAFDICQNEHAAVSNAMKQHQQQLKKKSIIGTFKRTFNEWSAIVKHRIVKPAINESQSKHRYRNESNACFYLFNVVQTDFIIAMSTNAFFGISFSHIKSVS